nr:carboxyltransferase domain-containing protein [Microbacterium sp. NIBRBAC000506063]
MVILPFGQTALLAEVASLEEVLALHGRLAASVPDGVIDLVPAARTVLVTFDPARITAAQVRAHLADGPDAARRSDAEPAAVEIDIVYDGPDLEDTAALLGISVEALVAAHREAEWTVAFTGFAPGFGYLVSAEWRFDVPRRESPRTRVPAGSVGLAGEFSGAYPARRRAGGSSSGRRAPRCSIRMPRILPFSPRHARAIP